MANDMAEIMNDLKKLAVNADESAGSNQERLIGAAVAATIGININLGLIVAELEQTNKDLERIGNELDYIGNKLMGGS